MSEMIDRVARALEQRFKDRVAASAGELFEDTGVASPSFLVWSDYARAAIEAMREVPESMRKFHTPRGDMIDFDAQCGYCGGHEFAWQAVIDEALK